MKRPFTDKFVSNVWVTLNAADQLPLSDAEQRLYNTIREAVMAYADQGRLDHLGTERRCMICGVPVNKCCC